MAVLTDDEREFVIEILTAQVAGNAAPRATLAQLLHESLREQLEVGGLVGILAARTVEIGVLSDYKLQPPALCAILQFLIDRTGDARLSPLLSRLERRIHVQPGPTQARILASRLPFADRDGLRPILSDMFTIAGAEPILLVRGDIESGKSYISELVEHICIRSSDAVFCKFTVKAESQARDATPRAIARDLVTQLGGDPNLVPPENTNTDAWLLELANWVVANANAASRGSARAWLVIDGLRDRVVLPDTALFLVKLAEKCALGVAAKRHRLLLSDFSEEHTGMLPIRMRRYSTEPIMRADVEAIVTEIIDASTQFPAAEKPALVAEAVSTVLDGLSPPLSSMTILGQRLRALIERAQL
jgi:hypothetical protein